MQYTINAKQDLTHIKLLASLHQFQGDTLRSQIFGKKYSRVDQEKFFKDCLPQILLGPLLNICPIYLAFK